MLFRARLKRYCNRLTYITDPIIIDSTCQDDIEVPGVGVEVMMPYLNPQHEGDTLHR